MKLCHTTPQSYVCLSLVMVMILQSRHNLSDMDGAWAVADRISWKYALGLDLDDAGFDASVLTEASRPPGRR